MHREPQPVKAYTIAPMYRYGAPGRGRYREHYQLSVEAIGSDDPAIDAEVIQLYTELLRRLGVTQWELHLNSIGDANCRPAYVEQLNAVARRARRRARRGGAAQARDEPAAGLRRQEPAASRGARGRAEDRRVALRRVPRALRRSSSGTSTRSACRTCSTRRSCAGSTTTRARRSSSSGPTRTPTRRSAAAGATTASSRRSAARRRRGSASAPASSGCCSRSRTRASPGSRRTLDVFVVVDGGSRETAQTVLQQLRRAGVSADMDYAGRSIKGQMTQAARTRRAHGRDRCARATPSCAPRAARM